MKKTFQSFNQLYQYCRQYFELLFWSTALVLLFFMKVDTTAPSLCIFRCLNIDHCPGCGLGHAIHEALHLQLSSSFHYHPLGIVAVLIILNRIKTIIFQT
jgi:hypothetical protein